MGIWPVIRRVVIENIVIIMLYIGLYFIYFTENARLGHCSCDPKLVAMKGQEIYYSGLGSKILMAYQEYGCICSARDNQSYLWCVLWICILFAVMGSFLIPMYCCENPDLTLKSVKVFTQLATMFISFHQKCCETKEEKEMREKRIKETMKEKKKAKEDSGFSKLVKKYPFTFNCSLIGFMIYLLTDSLMKSDRTIMEIIQDKKFTEPGLGIGFAMIIITGFSYIFAKEKDNKETEEDKWRKKVSDATMIVIGSFAICYLALALLGYSIRNNLKFKDLFTFEQWEIPIYMTMIFACIVLFIRFIMDGETYLLKKINPSVYDEDYEEIKL